MANLKANEKQGYHQFNSRWEGTASISDAYGSFEVFWTDAHPNADNPDEDTRPGWYWWSCLPGCLPDGDANGPFNSSVTAWRDARSY